MGTLNVKLLLFFLLYFVMMHIFWCFSKDFLFNSSCGVFCLYDGWLIFPFVKEEVIFKVRWMPVGLLFGGCSPPGVY